MIMPLDAFLSFFSFSPSLPKNKPFFLNLFLFFIFFFFSSFPSPPSSPSSFTSSSSSSNFFLDATSHLYKRSCSSVRPQVRRSVGPSVGPSRVIFEGEKYAYQAHLVPCIRPCFYSGSQCMNGHLVKTYLVHFVHSFSRVLFPTLPAPSSPGHYFL